MRQSVKVLISFLLCGFISSGLAKSHGMMGGMPPAIVSAEPVKIQAWQPEIQATGSLSAFQGVMMKPEIAGRVTQIFFKSGEDVKQGTPLLELNQSVLQAQLALYKSNLALSKQQFSRASELIKTHAIAKADFDTAQANLNSAQAQFDEANAQLKQTIITAPFSGRLGLRLVSLGDYVSIGQDLVSLQSLDPIIVNFSVPETYVKQIMVGDTVLLHSDAFPNQAFKGKVYAFDSVIDPNTRTLAMRASIPNPEKKLLPGAFVAVNLLVGKEEKVIKIPQTALGSSLTGAYVYRVINGKAVKTSVVVGKREDQMAIIESGLAAGDIVITDGEVKIAADNSPVMVMPATKPVSK